MSMRSLDRSAMIMSLISVQALRIDYGDGRVIKGSSTKMVISQLWNVIFRSRHAIHH